jgi:hypothetical protein
MAILSQSMGGMTPQTTFILAKYAILPARGDTQIVAYMLTIITSRRSSMRGTLILLVLSLLWSNRSSASECADTDATFCHEVAGSGLCGHPYIQNVTQTNCGLSCGSCTPG